jgi:hypothetical protein
MSRYSPLPPEVLDTIAACGFDVYQNPDPHWQTYLYFTDGKNIGYLQRGDWGGLSISTVHVPNKACGTGFNMMDDRDPPLTLTRAGLSRAFAHAPSWASHADREAVRKWRDMAAFMASHNRLVKVREAAQ